MNPIPRRCLIVLTLTIVAALSTGCMYRGEIERQQNNPLFVKEEIARVQTAVELFFRERGVYPIKNADMTTPVYEKYIIDLTGLVQSGMLSAIPANAFENGGRYYYLLIEPETKPAVKLMDLVAYQRVGAIQKRVNNYALANNGTFPLGTEISEGFYSIDFDKLGEKSLQIQSLHSNQYLPLVLHESGQVGVDYSLEIMDAIRKSGETTFPEDIDLRTVLVEDSLYVPVLSFPYRWVDGTPELSPK